jgi:undecaprenyl-phosphate alpha-N-acetylglucosaminyl 1-phosphatetransferase
MDDAKLVAASAIALAVTLFSIFSMRPIARRLGLVDRPDERKRHRGRVPLIGGLCFFLGTIAGLLYLGYIDRFVAGLLVPCALIVMTGAVDDLHNLSVRSRLVIQTCAAGLVIAATGVYLDDTGHVFGGGLHLGLAGIPITIVAVIGLINAFNMLDGIDGLAASLAMVSIGAIMLFSGAGLPTLGVMLLLQVLFASLVPYLFVNLGWPDGRKVFMGDAGSTLIGFLLGWSLIFLSHTGVQRLQPVDALWCVALPVMDTLAVMSRRMRKRLSPFKPDRQHLHHLLQDTGCSARTTLAAIVTAGGVLSLTGYALRDAPEMLSGGVFLALLVAYVLYFQHALEWLCSAIRSDDAQSPARTNEAAPLAEVPQHAAIRALCVMATPSDAIRIAPIARELSRDSRFDAKVCVAAQRDQTPVQVLSLFDMQPDMQLRVIARPGQPEDITSMTLGGMKRVLRDFKPDVVVIPSDASATLATTLAAFYQQIPVVCIESDGAQGSGRAGGHAGHRIASELASLHFTPSESAREQLREGGVPADRIVVSGNPAMGTLRTAVERIRHDAILSRDLAQCFAFLRSGSPLLLVADGESMHFNGADPFDVEPAASHASHARQGAAVTSFAFEPVCRALRKIAMRRPDVDIVYPLSHPASARIDALLRACPNIHLVSPTDYLSFAYLLHNATVVLSDASELASEMAAMGKRVLLMNDGTSTATTPRTALHEQAIAAGVLGLLNLRSSESSLEAAVERGRDTCERIADALAGFASHAGLSARPRPTPAPAVAAMVEALREAS